MSRSKLPDLVLWGLLAALTIGVLSADRSDWRGFIGDEATYLMAAESLAWDFDLTYTKADFDRLLEHWGEQSEILLFLQSKDRGETIVYAKPFFFPLFAAPLTRISPKRGALAFNLLMLWLAAWTTLAALRPVLGKVAPIWVAVFLFASVSWAYAFWAHADIFLMSLVAIGLGLAFQEPGDSTLKREALRWAVVGCCLAVVGFSRPFYLTLLLPAFFAAQGRSRWVARSAFIASVGLILFGAGLTHWSLGGSPTSYTGDRKGFYARTGLPDVDFPADSWGERDSAFVSWHEAEKPLEQPTDSQLWAWNGLYLLAGEHIGLIPYYLPLLLGLAALGRDRLRWLLLIAVALSLAALFLYRPFNFYGGGAAIANRYFLPMYPAFWFLVTRKRSLAWPMTVTLLAIPFLWPVWTQPGSYPLRDDLTYRFVSPAARLVLPFETTQSHVKPSGQEDVLHNGLWVRLLGPEVRALNVRDWHSDSFAVDTGRWAELLLATAEPIAGLTCSVYDGTDVELEVRQATLVGDSARREHLTTYQLELEGPRARHPMWWTWDRWYLYRIGLRLDAPAPTVRFHLEPVAGNDS